MALMYQIWHQTHSTLLVGLLGLVQVVPTVAFALVGGAIADAMDRRRLLMTVQTGMMVCAAGLAVLATTTPPLWALYVLAAVMAAMHSVDGPARQAVIPMVVDETTLRSAVQLREVLTQSSRVFGPLLGGVLIGNVSLASAYAVDAATFVIAFIMFRGLPSLMPAERRRFELSSITESLHYVRSEPVLAGTFIADLVAMILGMPRAVFPAMATVVYNAGPTLLGVLYAAPAMGALAGILVFGGLTARIRREGLAVLIAICVWGASIAVFGLSHSVTIGVLMLAIAGAADMVSAVFRQTILLDIVPDNMRGRMGAVHIMVVTGGPPLGDLEAGAAAAWLGLRASIVFGGLACVGGMGAVAVALPQLRRWTRPDTASIDTP